MSGPLAEDAPLLVFTKIGKRALLGHDPFAWPIVVDVGALESGRNFVVLACGHCGEHLLELQDSELRTGDWTTSPGDMLQRISDHAIDCEAFV
jgi:hypothetical protein